MITVLRFVAALIFFASLYAGYYTLKNYQKLFGLNPDMPSEGSSSRAYSQRGYTREAAIRPNKRYRTGNDRIVRGWAEPHFSSSFGVMPPGVMVIYAPRDEQEKAVCRSLFRSSYACSVEGCARRCGHSVKSRV